MRMRSLLAAALLAVPLGLAAAAPAPQARRIVVFDAKTTQAMRLQTVQKFGVRVVREIPLISAIVVSVPPALQGVEREMAASPLIVRVDDDIYGKWLEGDETFAPLPSLREVLTKARQEAGEPPTKMPVISNPTTEWKDEGEFPWGIQRVSAAQAWKAYTGKGVKVAVVDTGIDAGHPDLKANVIGGFNAVDSSATAHDDHGHGTHVAGTVGAVSDGQGVVGVAPEASLLAVKVLDANGSGYISDIIAGIDWAVAQKAQVINMSLGGPRGNDSFHESVKKAVAAGTAVICAAGNSGAPRKGQNSTVGYPAAYPEAVAVAASGSKDELAYFSSRGPEVDFIAPGYNVKSTVPGGAFDTYSGTSMASPHMAGLAALAINAGAKGPEGVREALKKASSKLPNLTPNEQGVGLPDAARLTGAFRVLPIGATR